MRDPLFTRLLAVALIGGAASLAAAQTTPPERDSPSPERLVFLLEYIGSDYAAAVSEGRIVSPFEYREMVDFSATVLEHYDALAEAGAGESLRGQVDRLCRLIRELAPVDEVRALSGEIVGLLLERLDIVTFPAVPPDPERGRELFAANCAPCHGARGGGDGFAAPVRPRPGRRSKSVWTEAPAGIK